jgi:hypothetical protein
VGLGAARRGLGVQVGGRRLADSGRHWGALYVESRGETAQVNESRQKESGRVREKATAGEMCKGVDDPVVSVAGECRERGSTALL